MAEDFPRHEALEAANDLRLGLFFRGAVRRRTSSIVG
jgi:hypothetical protein